MVSDPWEMLRSSRDILTKNGVEPATDESGQYSGFVATVDEETYCSLVDVTNSTMRGVRLRKGYRSLGDDQFEPVIVDAWYFERERIFVVHATQ